MSEFVFAHSSKHFNDALSLFKEYAEWLGIDLSFQNFDKEIKEIEKTYASPKGCVIIAYMNTVAIGCVAVKPIGERISELKRMYVKPAYQHNGIGQTLLNMSLNFALDAGYEKIRLDTLEHMTPAMNLYQKNGFYQIPAYYFNPEKNAVYFEKLLC